MIYRRNIIVASITIGLIIILYLLSSFFQSYKYISNDNESKRIATFSASITEVVYYLGLDEMLVANTDYCSYPEDAKNKYKIGSLGNINYELLIALGVNVAILPTYMQESVSILNSYGIDTITVDHNNIDGIMESINTINTFFRGFTDTVKGKDMISLRLKNVENNRCSLDSKKRVLFVVFHDINESDIGSITVAANDGYYSDIISRAGGDNIFANILSPYPVFDKEAVLISNPDVIIELLKPGDNKEHILNQWLKLKDITAVKNREIYLLDDIAHSIPGPRFIDTLETILSIICGKEMNDATS